MLIYTGYIEIVVCEIVRENAQKITKLRLDLHPLHVDVHFLQRLDITLAWEYDASVRRKTEAVTVAEIGFICKSFEDKWGPPFGLPDRYTYRDRNTRAHYCGTSMDWIIILLGMLTSTALDN